MEALHTYLLRLADDTLLLGQQLGSYCSFAPYLEEDLAIANTALDLIGQAESIYAELAKQTNGEWSERELVYRRSADGFLNHQLVEQPHLDFAHLIVRQFFMDNYHFHLYETLSKSKDPFLFAFANKSIKEVTYHLRRSSEWMIRLGDGTEEAHEKTQRAIDTLYPFTDALFKMDEVDFSLFRKGISADRDELKTQWDRKVNEIFFIGGFQVPKNYQPQLDGRNGIHTPYLSTMLDELQSLHRNEPEAVWL